MAHPERLYAMVLFAAAFAVLSVAIAMHGWLPGGHGPVTAVFFVVFALFTIAMGFEHPRAGYVSFDRIAQVASILILGPVAAAWLNGLASLLYPWHRLRRGRPLQEVLTASLHNSGLMSLMVLGIGLAYQQLGGPVPLSSLGMAELALLLLMLVGMQAVNEFAMRIFIGLREGRWPRDFDVFAFIVESGAGLGGILVAIIFNRMELAVVALLFAVLSLGMLTLTQLARLRAGLETMVAERTRSLREKTLELERLATHDPLTGLRNRRSADDYLLARIAEFERYGGEFSVAIVDLDHFKRINDDFSHVDGDRVLEAVATRMAASARGTDLVARFGGEEFLLGFPATALADAVEACEKIRLEVAAMNWAGGTGSWRRPGSAARASRASGSRAPAARTSAHTNHPAPSARHGCRAR